MATPTLDEIEARLNTQQPDLTRDYQLAILALVAHVRALKKVLPARADLAVDRITTLEAKVAVLEAPTTLRAWADGLARSVDASTEMDRLRAENAELRKAAGWPTPQPIETAPLGQLMAWPADADEEGGPTWSHEWPQEGETWREALKQFGHTHWLPMPPPPQNNKEVR